MIPVVKADGRAEREFIGQLRSRGAQADKAAVAAVTDILEQVRLRGDTAVKEYSIRFDGWAPECPEVDAATLQQAQQECDPQFLAALKRACENIRDFHQRQKQQSWLETKENGVILGQHSF